MIKLLVKSVVLSACVLGLVGCGSGMPSCDDKEVKELAADIIKNRMIESGATKEEADNFKITGGFITNSKDEGAKKVTCKADTQFTHRKETIRGSIDYRAQHTNDGKVYVEVIGF